VAKRFSGTFGVGKGIEAKLPVQVRRRRKLYERRKKETPKIEINQTVQITLDALKGSPERRVVGHMAWCGFASGHGLRHVALQRTSASFLRISALYFIPGISSCVAQGSQTKEQTKKHIHQQTNK
jgi:hypothetical protein